MDFGLFISIVSGVFWCRKVELPLRDLEHTKTMIYKNARLLREREKKREERCIINHHHNKLVLYYIVVFLLLLFTTTIYLHKHIYILYIFLNRSKWNFILLDFFFSLSLSLSLSCWCRSRCCCCRCRFHIHYIYENLCRRRRIISTLITNKHTNTHINNRRLKPLSISLLFLLFHKKRIFRNHDLFGICRKKVAKF